MRKLYTLKLDQARGGKVIAKAGAEVPLTRAQAEAYAAAGAIEPPAGKITATARPARRRKGR